MKNEKNLGSSLDTEKLACDIRQKAKTNIFVFFTIYLVFTKITVSTKIKINTF